ncbi:PhzF family phenazine biosynthesis protein [Paenibacillus sp. MER TA 81-3]|uniref:PhzF family phenazine biosynthesis protein n=1 Tax=Paenibacillus sp. MER TA 81-3 TaxID=2939573 RepID=UPI00203F4300|nr:PhzF family phenazine biosynthesis isomerase [Paenibacillus sp. MER TA 81-3]MCM3341490.1 PhzF family phenazine biosynthesis protein [Paenibacillus sp. MER TA 81-3]
MKLFTVDAFTDKPFHGNPAAVCLLEHEMDSEQMQQIAMEMNLSETAFIIPLEEGDRSRYRLRWFTPQVEVDLCGHATLASAHVLCEQGLAEGERIAFETMSGTLYSLYGENGQITLDFPASSVVMVSDEGLQGRLEEALGCSILGMARSRIELLVEADSEQTVRELKPDWEKLLRCDEEVIGVLVTAPSAPGRMDGADFVSRCFFPSLGVNEDPVTGSAHCTMAPYWAQKWGRTSFIGEQCSARGGMVQVELQGERALLTGQAVTVMEGKLTID